MIRKLFIILTALTTVWACAPVQGPKIKFPAGTRIGIVNHLEAYATHHNFSSLRFDSFSKQIDVDWDIPAYVEDRLSNALKADSRYTIVSIKPAETKGGINIDKHPLELAGYGLLTQQLLMSKHAYSYANITVEVFKTRPLAYIGSGKPENRKSSIKNINLEGKLKNIPRSEIEKLEPLMKDYAEKAVQNAIESTNLVSPAKK